MGAPGTGKSLTLQNIAVNMANEGYNVAYISLELSDKKCLKRIGSMRLEIPIKDYNELSKDKEYLRSRINDMNNRLSGGLGEHKCGKLYVKEYPSGTATISDIDAYCQQVEDEAGIKLDALFIDYIQIMNTEKGIDRNMLYLKGEHLSVGLRAIAQKRDLVACTATQTDKNKYGANSYSLADIPESKSIADTADTVWGIVLTPLMKLEGKYQWQHLKLRDSSTDIERIQFSFNKDFLRLGSDEAINSTI
jgi:replicative DNA helicase